jgi:hypothetical protein
MNIFYNIMLMYALAFVIGLFVAFIIWVLYSTMTAKSMPKTRLRESYLELRQLRRKNKKSDR